MIKILLSILLSFLLFSCATTNKKNIEEAKTFYEAGTAALVQGDFTDALERLLRAVELDPKNPFYQNNLAYSYQKKKLYDKAKFHFERALELKKDFPDAQNNLGVLYLEMGKPKEAIKYCEMAAKDPLYKTPQKAYLNIGRAYYKLKNFEKALEYQRKSVTIDKNFCYAYNSLGMTEMKVKNFKSAANSFKRAINICKTYEAPYYVLGLNYLKARKRKLALKQFNVLLRKFPEGKYSAKAEKIINVLRK
jgi:type IV pilus assembly protein PilF